MVGHPPQKVVGTSVGAVEEPRAWHGGWANPPHRVVAMGRWEAAHVVVGGHMTQWPGGYRELGITALVVFVRILQRRKVEA